MAEMKAGDVFDVRGYDIVARINYAESGGEAIVLCNNASHFLVAIRQGDDDSAEFEKSFPYHEDGSVAWNVYREAVKFAVNIALRR